MSSLTEGHLELRRVKKSPEEQTKIRLHTAKVLGVRLKPSKKEIAAYVRAGKNPPTE